MPKEIMQFTEFEAEQKQGAKLIASFEEDFTFENEKLLIFVSSLNILL